MSERAQTVAGDMLGVAFAAAVLAFYLFVLGGMEQASGGTVQCKYRDGGALPSKTCTPGALNPDVTQATVATTICKRGWATSVRPPESVTEPQKFQSMRAYNIPTSKGFAGQYEYDHLVSLELGGSPDDTLNLWPEIHTLLVGGAQEGSFVKDTLENQLNRDVCTGFLTLSQAQHAILSNWLTAYKRYVGALPKAS